MTDAERDTVRVVLGAPDLAECPVCGAAVFRSATRKHETFHGSKR